MKKPRLKLFKLEREAFDFLMVFVAVISAFALNNWNEDRKDKKAAREILAEVRNGLEKDLIDLNDNLGNHKKGIKAVEFYRNILNQKPFNQDSVRVNYFWLTRDFISLQNRSAYETLKSKGLELIKNDSIRYELISLYEYDYNTLRVLEESYNEMQFHQNYFLPITQKLAPFYVINEKGKVSQIKEPVNLSPSDKNEVLIYLDQIEANRGGAIKLYDATIEKVHHLKESIDEELEDK